MSTYTSPTDARPDDLAALRFPAALIAGLAIVAFVLLGQMAIDHSARARDEATASSTLVESPFHDPDGGLRCP